MSTKPRSSLLALPNELIAMVVSYLSISDLQAIRLTNKTFSETGFDALIPFMKIQRKLKRPSQQAIESFLLLSRTPKARDTVRKLATGNTLKPLTYLANLILPNLVRLDLERASLSTETLLGFLSTHATKLDKLGLEHVALFAAVSDVEYEHTSGWRKILGFVVDHMQLSALRLCSLKYITETWKTMEIATYPEKRWGSRYAQGCCEEFEYKDGAFIDVDWTDATTKEAVLRVASAWTDGNGKERPRVSGDRDMDVEWVGHDGHNGMLFD